MAHTAARADMVISNNATWEDAFRFGTAGDTSWSFADKAFLCDVKGTRDDPTALLSLSTSGNTIVVDDVVTRTLHFNVDRATVSDLLPVRDDEPYVYDLIMVDLVTGTRTQLLWGEICVEQGVTQT